MSGTAKSLLSNARDNDPPVCLLKTSLCGIGVAARFAHVQSAPASDIQAHEGPRFTFDSNA